MAWHKRSVQQFLVNQNVDQVTAQAILRRVDQVMGDDEIFSSTMLDRVMGDPTLVEQFERAWERDPSLRRAAITSL